MISLHPTKQQLHDFVEGNCAPAMALVISAHVDMCQQCQREVAFLQEEASDAAFADIALTRDFDAMLANITQLPVAESTRVSHAQDFAETIELDGRKFKLPRALQRCAGRVGNWSHLIGNLYQAPVDLGPIGKANFIYMEKGGRVPEHTHRGSEMTLVIDGEFSDGLGNYDSGDFILMDETRKHTPRSDADEGCLVFSIVDKPLHFTSGVARLLNPFSHLFF